MKLWNHSRSLMKALPLLLTITFASAVEKPEFVKAFEALPPAEKKAFGESLNEANRYLREKRVFDTLDALSAAESLIPSHPLVMQIQAACHIEFREFPQAEKIYLALEKQFPTNPSYVFNVGEVFFVQAKWKEASGHFSKLLESMRGNENNNLYYLAEFKNYICNKKLGNKKAAQIVENKYDFSSDTPAYYYINYVKLTDAKDKKATEWLLKARRVFRNPQILGPWQDTLSESGYITSVYGGGDRGLEMNLIGEE